MADIIKTLSCPKCGKYLNIYMRYDTIDKDYKIQYECVNRECHYISYEESAKVEDFYK